jgi:hypothetical protein
MLAQQRIKAATYFTTKDDGLRQAWRGRVWLNPPYAQPLMSAFVGKLVAEHRIGNVRSAILLTHNYTDTVWFHEAARACDVICFTRGRVRFEKENGEIAAPTQGQAVFYFGDDSALFREVFSKFGLIARFNSGAAEAKLAA